MAKSSIEWTDETWNPVRGCVKVSPGCKHCYAETFAERWRGIPGHAYEQGFDLRLVPDKLGEPLSWRKPRNVFVNSMSDLFQEGVPFEFIAAVYGVMAVTRKSSYQVLTKRPERRREWHTWLAANKFARTEEFAVQQYAYSALDNDPRMLHPIKATIRQWPWPLVNVWEGVTVEDRKYGVPRIAILRDTPAAVRFLSIEPLLEDLGTIDLTGIDWVIVGAESGNGARPMHDDWVRSIRDQALAAGCKFFFKQRATRGGRKLSLPVLDGRQWAEMPGAHA